MTSLQNIDDNFFAPMHPSFNKDVLKLDMNGIIKIALEEKPISIYKSYKIAEEKTIDMIMLMIIQFQNFYNCKSKMEKVQLEETAYMIVQNFRHLNYYDIGMCLKQAKLHTKVYDRIDGGMILELLTSYDINRTGMIVNEREKQKAQQNAEWSGLGERSSEITIKDLLKFD
jgi:hypothetical protein